MTPEQRDAATEHEQDQREFARRMEMLSAALDEQTGVYEAARQALDAWEAMT